MIIESLKLHFPARFPEWLGAGTQAGWGAYLILHPGLFEDDRIKALWVGLAAMASQPTWGLAAMLVGIIRAFALFVNGAYVRTPVIRLVTSFASAFVWTQVIVGFLKSETPNTGLIVYTSLIVADIYSAYRASADVTLASRSKIIAEEERERATGKPA